METMRRGSDKLALEKKGQECYNNVVSACVWTLIQRQIAGTKFSRILQTSFLFIYILTQRILASFHHACGSLVSCIRKTNDFRNNPKY
jgi:hypothetical protein